MNTSQIAVKAANEWLSKTVTIGVQESLILAIQSAIDKATAGMVPIEDVNPLLDLIRVIDDHGGASKKTSSPSTETN